MRASSAHPSHGLETFLVFSSPSRPLPSLFATSFIGATMIWSMAQVFYELEDERQRVGATDVALLRVEQLCPFPFDLCDRELKRYPSEYLTKRQLEQRLMLVSPESSSDTPVSASLSPQCD